MEFPANTRLYRVSLPAKKAGQDVFLLASSWLYDPAPEYAIKRAQAILIGASDAKEVTISLSQHACPIGLDLDELLLDEVVRSAGKLLVAMVPEIDDVSGLIFLEDLLHTASIAELAGSRMRGGIDAGLVSANVCSRNEMITTLIRQIQSLKPFSLIKN